MMILSKKEENNPYHKKHLISVNQIQNIHNLKIIFQKTKKFEMALKNSKKINICDNLIMLNFFFEPSTRTKLSFAVAFNKLGGKVIEIAGPEQTAISKGESLENSARIISSYVDIIVMRHNKIGALDIFAKNSIVPVINAGDGIGEHPTQAILDVYTIYKEFANNKFEKINSLSIAIVGDLKNGRTVHSLVMLLSLFSGIKIYLVSTEHFRMPKEIILMLQNSGIFIIESDEFSNIASKVDIIYMTRTQQERFISNDCILSENSESFIENHFYIDQSFYKNYCKNNPLVMHPLPINNTQKHPEIDNDITNNPHIIIFRQSDNGTPIRMALIDLILNK